jgi:plasmid maintenance system antidote protein VapI
MVTLNKQCKKEKDICEALKKAVDRKILKEKWSERQVADKLGLLPTGAKALVRKESWTIETAIRVADALDVNFMFIIKG